MTTDRDEQIRQMSIELAARQRDLVTIWELIPDTPPTDIAAAAELIGEIANIADPDGWADGTAELAWEAAAEAPVGRDGPGQAPALADLPDEWTLVVTFETGVRAERKVRALYLIGDAILDTRSQLEGEGAITRIELT